MFVLKGDDCVKQAILLRSIPRFEKKLPVAYIDTGTHRKAKVIIDSVVGGRIAEFCNRVAERMLRQAEEYPIAAE